MNDAFLKRTIDLFQSRYKRKLGKEDAIEITKNIATLFNILDRWVQEDRDGLKRINNSLFNRKD